MPIEEPKKNSTSVLLRRLKNTQQLEKYLQSGAAASALPPFHIHISTLCKALGKVPEQVIKRSAIERTYGHQLFNGTRRPSRDKAIQLAFGLEQDLEGAQNLLRAAGKSPLYPKIKRDAAIIYCIHHHKDVFETQETLQALGLTLLGGEG